jgi:hypothetical protein
VRYAAEIIEGYYQDPWIRYRILYGDLVHLTVNEVDHDPVVMSRPIEDVPPSTWYYYDDCDYFDDGYSLYDELYDEPYDAYRDYDEEDDWDEIDDGYDDPFEDCLHGPGWAGPYLDDEDVEWAERELWHEEREIERAAEENFEEDLGPLLISPRKAALTSGIPRFPDRDPETRREKVKPWQTDSLRPPYSLRQLLAAA